MKNSLGYIPKIISNSLNWLCACSFPVLLKIFFYLFHFLVKFTLMFEWKLEGYFSKRFSKTVHSTHAYKRSVKTLDINKKYFSAKPEMSKHFSNFTDFLWPSSFPYWVAQWLVFWWDYQFGIKLNQKNTLMMKKIGKRVRWRNLLMTTIKLICEYT